MAVLLGGGDDKYLVEPAHGPEAAQVQLNKPSLLPDGYCLRFRAQGLEGIEIIGMA